MKIIKKIALGLLALFSVIMCFNAIFAFIVLGSDVNYEQGKPVILTIILILGVIFGFITVKCCKVIFHREEKRQTRTIDTSAINQSETNLNNIEHDGNCHKEDSSVNVEEHSDDPTDKAIPEEVQQLDNNGAESIFENTENVFTYRKFPKCNCDGCPKQDRCQYGHVIYDEFTRDRMTLADKFMLLDICKSDFPEASLVVATNEELHDMSLLMKLDKDALCETLEYLKNIKKWYYDYGKCGKAYFSFMKMENEISLVKRTIKEYDEYHNMLNSIELLKKTIIYKLEKTNVLFQDDLYKEFYNIERSWVTKAVRQLEKEKIIVREKDGKSYIIRKSKE